MTTSPREAALVATAVLATRLLGCAGTTAFWSVIEDLGELGGDGVELELEPGRAVRLSCALPPDVERQLVDVLRSAHAAAVRGDVWHERTLRLAADALERNRRIQRLEQRLDLLLDARDAFLVLAGHDLHTPLAVILGNAQMIEEGLLDAARTRQAAGMARRQAARIVELVDQAKERYAVGAAAGAERTTGDLRELVREVACARAARVEIDAPDSVPVHGDLDAIRDTLAVLLSRAASAATVRVRVDGESAVVELAGGAVADDGSAALRACRRTVAAHGGDLVLTQSRVRFSLPLRPNRVLVWSPDPTRAVRAAREIGASAARDLVVALAASPDLLVLVAPSRSDLERCLAASGSVLVVDADDAVGPAVAGALVPRPRVGARLAALVQEARAARRAFPVTVVGVVEFDAFVSTHGWIAARDLERWIQAELELRTPGHDLVGPVGPGVLVALAPGRDVAACRDAAAELVSQVTRARPRLGAGRPPVRLRAVVVDAGAGAESTVEDLISRVRAVEGETGGTQ